LRNSSPKRGKKKLTSLKNKSLLLGVTGGVAAYKSVDLVRRLRDEEASVRVIMTEASKNFITPLSLEVASQNRVCASLFDEPMAHISLPASSDLIIIAPATANILSKYAAGIADDLLSTCLLSFSGPVIIAPAMNWRMYENPIVREHLEKLASLGVIQVGPRRGNLACGEEGIGRMADVTDIVEAAAAALSKKDLTGEKIVVTAGPTREYLDPVRFISNRSSGKMGYALARAARNRGAEVVLISGPTALGMPPGVKCVPVETSLEMLEAVQAEVRGKATVLIMAAAVADYSPATRAKKKLAKKEALSLDLRATEDIISVVSGGKKRPFIIGFAAETGARVTGAVEKMKRKRMDMVVFNDVTEPGAGFDVDTNRVVVIDQKGRSQLDIMSKDAVADAILDRFREIKS
jgi:phosphopantothenoylcysteine decarboxylase/phosphopantothenate--cysteine ligase